MSTSTQRSIRQECRRYPQLIHTVNNRMPELRYPGSVRQGLSRKE